MVANGVPNKGTATKVKVSAKYVGREAVVITTPSQDRTGDLQRVRLADITATRPWVPAEAEARVAPMAGQAARVVSVSVDKGLFSSVGRACAP